MPELFALLLLFAGWLLVVHGAFVLLHAVRDAQGLYLIAALAEICAGALLMYGGLVGAKYLYG